MAGCLIFVLFIYCFSKKSAQALPLPELTVNPLMITETDSVTLNCQIPSHLSGSECYFHTARGEPAKRFSCLTTLSGTELLNMANQSSPAVVQLTCFYLIGVPSPDSEISSVIIRTSRPPEVTVSSPVINETDWVTLSCKTPPAVSVSECHFVFLSGGSVPSCRKTTTGTEMLKREHQRSHAASTVLKFMCFYTVKLGNEESPSPQSEISSITIHSQTPQISLQHFPGDRVLFTCSLPGSANPGTRCNLYFGETREPVQTITKMRETPRTKQSSCQFDLPIDDLLSRLHFPQQSDASCDYRWGRGSHSSSLRSDTYSLIDIVRAESRMTRTLSTVTMNIVHRSQATTSVTSTKRTTGLPIGTTSNTGSFVSSFPTSVKPTLAKMWIWKRVAVVVTACGVTLGLILLVLAVLCNRRKAEGSKDVRRRESKKADNTDTYHMYCTINDDPAASALKDMVYSTVQTH